ncbi:ribonuclease H-like domain-containing protein [Aspergillus bertholletiae]|uniref:Ribonuclease H-like domain-containing protein n=1 Tax=Aspergillus bertholletiae TaxID=1226010 RepID=A0A5N7ANY0_9EURO|nr:ribonuclease H-like domain-containing protein [Aspergillus bertholletiae]KAE8370996.1 ribonuclease H-like domain-containing protein [Aspergillus bertholletiae]
MSAVPSKLLTLVVDSTDNLLSLLDNVQNAYTSVPHLYLDLEGVDLSRHGSISILTLYIFPLRTVYIIDVLRLGEAAFTTTNADGISLRTILEAPRVKKVMFDVRDDSEALFNHYHISLDGVEDLQLMELATRKYSRKYVSSLAKCIEEDSPIPAAEKAEWKRQKEKMHLLFSHSHGGRREIFNERPLRPEIIQNCANDVDLLPGLYNVYCNKLSIPWEVKVQNATDDRIKLSQSPDYNPNGRDKALGPWNDNQRRFNFHEWLDDIDVYGYEFM